MAEKSIRDALKEKGGKDLYKELLRQLPVACLDDYYKNGVWLKETMKLDIEIVEAHRREAGAPDPIPLADVKVPDIPAPKVTALNAACLLQALAPGMVRPVRPAAGPLRPLGAAAVAAVRATLAGARPLALGQGISELMKAAQTAPAVAAALAAHTAPGAVPSHSPAGALGLGAGGWAAALAASAGGTAADLRQIAIFVTKWGLDPTRTKQLLSRLAPPGRRFVMHNFTYSPASGASPTLKLEEYIAQCEKTSLWGGDSNGGGTPAVPAVGSGAVPDSTGAMPKASPAAAAAPSPSPMPASPAPTGVKRSLEPAPSAAAPSKRPNPGAPASATAATSGATAAGGASADGAALVGGAPPGPKPEPVVQAPRLKWGQYASKPASAQARPAAAPGGAAAGATQQQA